MRAQSDILFAIFTWAVSSSMFIITYNLLPTPPATTIEVRIPANTSESRYAVKTLNQCLGILTTALKTSESKTTLVIEAEKGGNKEKTKTFLTAELRFAADKTLEAVSGKIVTPNTKIRLSSLGVSPIRVSVTGKIDERSIADSIEIPGPIKYEALPARKEVALLFPRKGLFRSGLLEYAQGALLGKFSFVQLNKLLEIKCKNSNFNLAAPSHNNSRRGPPPKTSITIGVTK